MLICEAFPFHTMGNNIFKLLQRWRKISSGQNARANIVYQSHQSALVTTARMRIRSSHVFRA
jgi:hypothetical protein